MLRSENTVPNISLASSEALAALDRGRRLEPGAEGGAVIPAAAAASEGGSQDLL